MKILLRENKNMGKDVECIIKAVFGKDQKVDLNATEVELPEYSDGALEKEMELLNTALGIRLEAGSMTMDDIDVDFFDENCAIQAMDKVLVKSCFNSEDADIYFNEVLVKTNVKAKGIDLIANTKRWERVLPNGAKVFDLVTMNLDEENKALLTRMVKVYNTKNNLAGKKERFVDPFMLCMSTFGGEIVKTAVSSAGEVLGNVAATVLNASFEGGKQALYSFSRDIKVGEIMTSKEAQAIIPNFKKQWSLAKENFTKNKDGNSKKRGNLL